MNSALPPPLGKVHSVVCGTVMSCSVEPRHAVAFIWRLRVCKGDVAGAMLTMGGLRMVSWRHQLTGPRGTQLGKLTGKALIILNASVGPEPTPLLLKGKSR